MKLELAYEVLNMLQTIQEAAEYMRVTYEEDNLQECKIIRSDIIAGLFALQSICKQFVPQESPIRLYDACKCALESIGRIDTELMEHNRPLASRKMEFELIPIVETMTLQFYYWGIVFEYPEKRDEFKNYLFETGLNRYVPEAEKSGQYKYDLTIAVTAYNHLDYTKRCVESILQQLPLGLKCEIILFNHGSSDGTREFFHSIPGAKCIDVAVNGVMPGILLKLIEGKYFIAISNDIVVGHNAIANLYRCISEHDDYGWVVPTTPNVSNLQTIEAYYSNKEELEAFTRRNNIYDEKRHEERVRLCNPITAVKSIYQIAMCMYIYEELHCVKNIQSFPDDKCSLWMRRNGLKLILAKDAYCHHFGSVTLGKSHEMEEEYARFYLEGRKFFYQSFGVDPWGTGFCYDRQLTDSLPYGTAGQVNILAINCGLGSNPLKIREKLKENNVEEKDIFIYNFLQDPRFADDVKNFSDRIDLFSDAKDIISKTKNTHYQYVIIEDIVRGYDRMEGFINEIGDKITFDILCYRGNRQGELSADITQKCRVTCVGQWVILQK